MSFFNRPPPKATLYRKTRLDRDELPMNDPNGETISPITPTKTYRSMDDSTEQAADDILSNVEAQSKLTHSGSDGFRPAVPGERAPLGVESVGTALGGDDDHPLSVTMKRPSFKQMAKRVQAMQRLRDFSSLKNVTSGISAGSSRTSNSEASMGHRRAKTLLASIDEAGKSAEDNKSEFLATDFSADLVSTEAAPPGAEHEGLNFLWNHDEEEKELIEEAKAEVAAFSHSSGRAPEMQPLLGSNREGDDDNHDGDDNAPTLEDVVAERRRMAQQRRNELRWKKIRHCLNPVNILKLIFRVLFKRTFTVSIPLFVAAWILFYYVGNPELDFLPGNATISWWFNFLGRQLIVFELSKLTEFILIDVLTMSSRAIVQMLGPWVTIFCLQSKGWPFVVAFWGLYDMILLHGDNPFQVHWFYWTGIKIYSQGNSGSYIIGSSAYLRVLIGMLLAGVATTLKRTMLTLYFGKRSFDIYKPKLEEILNDIIVITEIAELGAEADTLPDDTENQFDARQLVETNLKRRGQLSQVRWSSVKFQKNLERSNSMDSGASSVGVTTEKVDSSLLDSPIPEQTATKTGNPRLFMARSTYASKSSGLIRIKNLLDRWEEPVNKLDKATDSTVNDILKFRKALTYMDLEHPFGEAFGPASTRDELIYSAQFLYQRLLKLAPGSPTLPYSVLAVLTENDDGTIHRNLKKSIDSVFRADADGEIPILSFIQSCDVVYRKLRYFRASVGNASVIDKVLENMINGLYGFGLTVVIMSLLNFNPWPLLVSVSTLLVSFAFAIGPTAAKAIEGILLVVGTRPFDIGDRIIIANTPGLPTAGMGDSWFVEDITLFSTTLRMAANNEVATISNGAIAGARITNCARSKNAVVDIVLKLHISMHEGQNVDKFKDGLENYIADNPAVWDALVYLRCEQIDSDDESVMYRLAARSRLSWQVAARILADRGRLHQFCVEMAKELKVNFDSPTMRRVLYYGGNLVDGAVKDFKKNLLMDPANITKSQSGIDPFGMQQATSSGRIGPMSSQQASGSLNPDVEATPAPSSSVDDLFLAMVQQSHE